jgi:hypothetical protein
MSSSREPSVAPAGTLLVAIDHRLRGTQILLNGSPIFLRGVCVHAEAPYRTGRANNDEDMRPCSNRCMRWVEIMSVLPITHATNG